MAHVQFVFRHQYRAEYSGVGVLVAHRSPPQLKLMHQPASALRCNNTLVISRVTDGGDWEVGGKSSTLTTTAHQRRCQEASEILITRHPLHLCGCSLDERVVEGVGRGAVCPSWLQLGKTKSILSFFDVDDGGIVGWKKETEGSKSVGFT